MGQLANIRDTFRLHRRRWHAWREHLRRKRATVALLAILTLGLCEPVMCILHCQVWLPFAFQSSLAAQQHDHMHHHQHAAMDGTPAAETPTGMVLQAAQAPAPAICEGHISSRQGDTPFHVPPSPIHDMVPTSLALLIIVLIVGFALAAPPGDPPRIAPASLLRPPIPFAR